jgi:hypothetical protein
VDGAETESRICFYHVICRGNQRRDLFLNRKKLARAGIGSEANTSKWEDPKLKPGDVLTIKVITAARVDE